MQTQGLCPRTPGLHAADPASIPAGGSPPEDTGTVLVGASVLARRVRATELPHRSTVQLSGPVSSGGEPLAGCQWKSVRTLSSGVQGQSPCVCDRDPAVSS